MIWSCEGLEEKHQEFNKQRHGEKPEVVKNKFKMKDSENGRWGGSNSKKERNLAEKKDAD